MSLTTLCCKRLRAGATRTPVKSFAQRCGPWSVRNSDTRLSLPRCEPPSMKATPAALPRAMFLSVSVRSSTFPRRHVSPWPGSVFRIRAEADLFNIGLYTFRTWGEIQTDRYIRQLEDCCQLLADNPALGRPCDKTRRGLRRMKQGKHVVFYREEPGGILISRILHQSMLPEKQAIDDEDDTPDSL